MNREREKAEVRRPNPRPRRVQGVQPRRHPGRAGARAQSPISKVDENSENEDEEEDYD